MMKMTKKDIKIILDEYNVPEYYYSIGKQVDDCVCLENIDNKWIVYDSYRGQKLHIQSFNTIEEAFPELFDSVVIKNNIELKRPYDPIWDMYIDEFDDYEGSN